MILDYFIPFWNVRYVGCSVEYLTLNRTELRSPQPRLVVDEINHNTDNTSITNKSENDLHLAASGRFQQDNNMFSFSPNLENVTPAAAYSLYVERSNTWRPVAWLGIVAPGAAVPGSCPFLFLSKRICRIVNFRAQDFWRIRFFIVNSKMLLSNKWHPGGAIYATGKDAECGRSSSSADLRSRRGVKLSNSATGIKF